MFYSPGGSDSEAKSVSIVRCVGYYDLSPTNLFGGLAYDSGVS